MIKDDGTTFILGAATRLGASVLQALTSGDESEGGSIIAADVESRLGILGDIRSATGHPDRIGIASYSSTQPSLGLASDELTQILAEATTIFHLALARDRSQGGADIRAHNTTVSRQLIDIAEKSSSLKSIVVVTDVGLVGDYPGHFSEGWTDVSQIAFDEVDRTSLEVEAAFAEHKSLPTVRARVGLLSELPGYPSGTWRPAAEVLLPALRLLKALPRFLNIPSAMVRGSLAPLTPTEWAGRALVRLARNPEARGAAVHLISTPAPTMENVIATVTRQSGGARMRGGLPVGVIEYLGNVPGLTETAKRQADHLASWWTPHRYCLSRNNLDTEAARILLGADLVPPKWGELRSGFFGLAR